MTQRMSYMSHVTCLLISEFQAMSGTYYNLAYSTHSISICTGHHMSKTPALERRHVRTCFGNFGTVILYVLASAQHQRLLRIYGQNIRCADADLWTTYI
jgi:hypothetical protein